MPEGARWLDGGGGPPTILVPMWEGLEGPSPIFVCCEGNQVRDDRPTSPSVAWTVVGERPRRIEWCCGLSSAISRAEEWLGWREARP